MFCVFRLLFQLSFVPENVKVLMRAQIAQLIVSAIDHEQHGKDDRLMLTCISLLGNMAVTEPSCVPPLQEVCCAYNMATVTRLCLFACFKHRAYPITRVLFIFVAESHSSHRPMSFQKYVRLSAP